MSGDLHAARLISLLRLQIPDARIIAFGGDHMQAAGAILISHYRDFAILGFTDVLRNLVRLRALERSLQSEIANADLFIPVDYPGLNLRLAAHARRCKTPVLYYISPQIWAWGAGRIEQIARTVDCMAVILPFEEALYASRGIRVEFVGHPFVVDHPLPDPLPVDARQGVGLLPGSRVQEVRRILPVLLQAAKRMAVDDSTRTFTLACSAAVDSDVYSDILTSAGVDVHMSDDAVSVMANSRVALVASGTATLQTALMQTPLVVVYKVSPLNYLLARRLVKIANIGLVNVVLGEAVAPEFIQGRATAENIATAATSLLVDGEARDAMTKRFAGLREMLAGDRGCERVAEIAAELIA